MHGSQDLNFVEYKFLKCVFPGFFFYVYIESPNPKEPRRPQTTATENPNLKNPIQDPNPQTTINEQNWEKIIENNPGKKI